MGSHGRGVGRGDARANRHLGGAYGRGQCVAFSSDGTLLASGSRDLTKLWDVATQERIATLGHEAVVNAVSFSPDGTLLASGLWHRTS